LFAYFFFCFVRKIVGLPANFDYSKYLRKALTTTVQHTLEIKVTTWIILGSILLLLMGIYDLLNHDPEKGVWTFVGLGWLLLLIQVYFFLVSYIIFIFLF
jgi:hypothetical protein